MSLEALTELLESSKQQLESDEKDLTVKDTKTGIYLALRRKNFNDENEEKRFFKAVERIIRGSLEYREWVSFVKDTLQLDVCAFTGETDEETNDIEIHHHPFTLYDIVQMVTDTYIMNDKEFCSFDIAQEVLDLHYKLKVGFVPLIRSLHKKFHNGYLDIPIELVHGDYEYLKKTYFIRPETLEKVEKYEKIKLEHVGLYKWAKDRYNIQEGEK